MTLAAGGQYGMYGVYGVCGVYRVYGVFGLHGVPHQRCAGALIFSPLLDIPFSTCI